MPAARARRRGPHDDPVFGGAAASATAPKWAERFPATPEGFDALETHKQARRLPIDTDPDTIEDEDVKHAFYDRLREESDDLDPEPRRRGSSDSDVHPLLDDPRNTGGGGAGRRFSLSGAAGSVHVGDSLASLVFGAVGYALVINYIRGGVPQVRSWISAKATNGGGKLP